MTQEKEKLASPCDKTSKKIEAYIQNHLFGPGDIMYSGIDSHTGKPFARKFITAIKVPRHAAFDPWSYWTYEDSVMSMGFYIDGLIRQYQVTQDSACLEKAHKVWRVIKNIFYCSQVYGTGCFLRPYGGYEKMGEFMEPLGTDQASPLFSGLYLYMKYADSATQSEITDILLKTLEWYEKQDFKYFYYKFMIHEWDARLQHAASFYLPAIAWAAKVTGKPKWRNYLKNKIKLFEKKEFNLYRSFNWGSDLLVFAELLDGEFSKCLPQKLLDQAYETCQKEINAELGMIKHLYPESKKTGFKPYLMPDFDKEKGMGFAYFSCVHGGRSRPRKKLDFLCCLAGLNYPGMLQQALKILSLRQNVPYDFTSFLHEDYEILPEEVNIYARSTGVIMVEWWRNYWLLRGLSDGTDTSRKT